MTSSLSSPHAFRVLHVTYTSRSALWLVDMLNNPEIAGLVEEISFKEQGPRRFGHAPDDDDQATLAALFEAFSSLDRAPNLKSISFAFGGEALDDNEWYTDHHNSTYIHLQWTIIRALSRNALPHPSLKSLVLKNMIPYMPSALDPSVYALYRDPALAAFIASLHHLHVFILRGDIRDGDGVPESLLDFWDTILERVLQPAVALRSLELGTERTVGGAHIPVNFSNVRFPYLESISLKNFQFDSTEDPDIGGTEDFILRHKDTLTKLELVECVIEVPDNEDAPLRFWADIWETFAQELGGLRELKVSFEDWKGERQDPQVRYVYLDPFSYMPMEWDMPGEERDRPALRVLKNIIKARRGENQPDGDHNVDADEEDEEG